MITSCSAARLVGPSAALASVSPTRQRAQPARLADGAATSKAAGGIAGWRQCGAASSRRRSPASASAALPAAAAAAVDATFFSPAAWAAWSSATLGVYVLYFATLAFYMPKGRPVTNIQDKRSQPGLYRLLMSVIFAVLVPTFIVPPLAVAVSGAWRAGVTYFLPVMVQVIVNIAIELRTARSGRVLAVYASTVGNNMWRLGASLAALFDMAMLGSAHPALVAASALQAVAFVAVQLIMVPAAISTLPVILLDERPGVKLEAAAGAKH